MPRRGAAGQAGRTRVIGHAAAARSRTVASQRGAEGSTRHHPSPGSDIGRPVPTAGDARTYLTNRSTLRASDTPATGTPRANAEASSSERSAIGGEARGAGLPAAFPSSGHSRRRPVLLGEARRLVGCDQQAARTRRARARRPAGSGRPTSRPMSSAKRSRPMLCDGLADAGDGRRGRHPGAARPRSAGARGAVHLLVLGGDTSGGFSTREPRRSSRTGHAFHLRDLQSGLSRVA